MKLVSAICPTFNRPAFLAESVKMFLAQTYENREMVIIDSGHDYALLPQDPRIKYIRVEPPTSPGDCYRLAMQVAQGDYLAIWDDDDYHGPGRLEKTIAAIEGLGVDACGTTPVIVLLGNRQVRFARWTYETIHGWHTGPSAWMPCSDSSLVWKRDSSKHEERRFKITMDMFRQMHDAGATFYHIDNAELFAYVRHPRTQWRHDWAKATEPVMRPAWIPDTMIKFWENLAL